MSKGIFKLVVLTVVLAVVVGYLLASQGKPLATVDPQIQRLALEGAKKAQTISLVFKVSMLTLVVLFTAGVLYQIVSWLSRKANTIYPNADGVFPVIKVGVGRTQVLHDPNRAPTSATVYAIGDQGAVNVVHVLPRDFTSDQQLQTTTQAQVTQAVIAATRQGVNAQTRQLVEHVVTRPPARPALPEVEVLDIEPSHVERLLEDHGGS